MSSSIVIKKINSKNSKNKSLVYYSKYIELCLNDKYNWYSPSSQKKIEYENKNLYKLLQTVIQNRNYEITGYDLMLMVQETKNEDILLDICKNIKEKINDPLYIFDYSYNYEDDHQHHIYNDILMDKEYDNHSLLMLILKKNFTKIAKLISSYSMINYKVEAYNQYKKSYVNIYTYALDNKNYDILNIYLKRDPQTFWKFMRYDPLSLYNIIEDKSVPLIDNIIENNIDIFNDNQIYMELAMGLNQKSVITLIENGEINPFYIDRNSGNSAFISAVYTKNIVLFEKLMEISPMWYLLNRNIENKSAIDYLQPKSKKVINNYMYDRLHTYIKIYMEKPKVIIMNGKDRIYIGNNSENIVA